MELARYFTRDNDNPYEGVEFETRECRITDSDGTVVYDLGQIVVPKHWSQISTNVLAHKYLRKAGVPSGTIPITEAVVYHEEDIENLPEWLLPRVAHPDAVLGSETDCRQVFHRLAGCWTYWGWILGYFTGNNPEAQAKAFYNDLKYLLVHQMWAPNSPQWFNTGLHWAYGIEGSAQGHWYVDAGEVTASDNGYERPQVHACYIQGINDSLVRDGGILDLVAREARLFKMGGGTGTNFSPLRAEGEPLSGGGRSSGLMSFLGVGDKSAGAIKSGGTTRRAAKMVVLDVDHPDIEEFIDWKLKEERKVAALIVGSRACSNHARAIQKACETKNEKRIVEAVQAAYLDGVPENLIRRVIHRAQNGEGPIEFDVYNAHWEGEAYRTVSGQNANNSVSIPNEFIDAVVRGESWDLLRRTDRSVAKSVDASVLWGRIVNTAWACADPGVQFSSTINAWNTVPRDGRITGTNPCAEYIFLDDTACNLASHNLLKFLKEDGTFDIEGYAHACTLSTIVLDISVSMAQYPYKKLAENSLKYRTLGLGYANLGALLMCMGYSYDSPEGREIAACITAIMGGMAQGTSAHLAHKLGTYPAYARNKEHHLAVVGNHYAAVSDLDFTGDVPPLTSRLTGESLPSKHRPLITAAQTAWQTALDLGYKWGYRNAQVTCLAPTGTIGLVMGCDTTGIEPDFALRKFKTLAGGGHMEIANGSISKALLALQYAPEHVLAIMDYVTETGGIEHAPFLKEEHLPIFDCANPCGHSQRMLSPMSHVYMMAAVQPFLSGGISKTVNLPADATPEDIADIYMAAWTHGIKCISVYRDASKLSQPLNTAEDPFFKKYLKDAVPKEDAGPMLRSPRRALPSHRAGYTQKLRISTNNFYVRTGEYEDGTLGEIFLDSAKSGTMVKAMLNCFAIAVSLGLQHGVPLDEYVDAFTYTHFDPSGPVHGHDNIKMCSSVFDAIFRDLGFRYLGRDDLVHIRAGSEDAAEYPDVQQALITQAHQAKSHGYEGIPCPDCSNMTMVRSGTCLRCVECGATTGCS